MCLDQTVGGPACLVEHEACATAATEASIDERIAAMTRRVVERFNPLRVILSGSRARGDARPHSDVDLLIVFPHLDNPRDNPRRTAVEIAEVLGGSGLAKDVVVTTPEEIARRGHLIGTVLEPALREGRILYERG